MWAAISGIIQIIYILLNNKFERDAAEKKRKEALGAEATKAIISRNASSINSVLTKLRK